MRATGMHDTCQKSELRLFNDLEGAVAAPTGDSVKFSDTRRREVSAPGSHLKKKR
jgi:hypothetical protein